MASIGKVRLQPAAFAVIATSQRLIDLSNNPGIGSGYLFNVRLSTVQFRVGDLKILLHDDEFEKLVKAVQPEIRLMYLEDIA